MHAIMLVSLVTVAGSSVRQEMEGSSLVVAGGGAEAPLGNPPRADLFSSAAWDGKCDRLEWYQECWNVNPRNYRVKFCLKYRPVGRYGLPKGPTSDAATSYTDLVAECAKLVAAGVPRPGPADELPSWQSGDTSAGDAPAQPGDAWRPGAALDGPAAAVDVGGGGQRHIYSQKATFWHPNDVASWRTTCKEYWRVNSENLVDQFCNADSFAMAMRMKYGLKLEDPEHHWNGVGSPSVNEKRHRDFVEYMDECKQMNRAEESFADVSGFTEIAKKDLTDAVPPVQSAKSVQGSSRSRSGRRDCETCDRGLSCTHATLCEGESDEENKCDLENEDRKGCCYYKTYSCWDDDNEQIYF